MTAPLRLFNSLTRELETFSPIHPGEARVYSCGPTVYNYPHIGNMRAYVFADVLGRTLSWKGYQLTHVINITDVGHLTGDTDDGDDKLEVAAKKEGLDAWAVAKRYTDAFFQHAALLNIKRPKIICKATDFIKEQIAMVQELESKGFTYRTDDGIYFDTAKFPKYPDFARLDVKGLQEGHRVDAADKRAKTDFALWKFSNPKEKRQMEWSSPWGTGFPGWHIECSAMAMKFLGPQFDIHTGGVDHIPIHHTNEIAQSECATGLAPFVKYWMHGEFLIIEGDEKMSKSLGNTLTVGTLEEKGFPPLGYRVLILQSHYRKQLRFSYENLVGAVKAYERLTAAAIKLRAEAGNARYVGASSAAGQKHLAVFHEAMSIELNTTYSLGEFYSVM
jgi:cysteinyl-tRNA synthetase